MPAQFTRVLSGFAVSSAVAADPANGTVGVFVGSHANTSIWLDYSTASGGGGEWHRFVSEGGVDMVIASATALPAVGLARVAVPWVRVHLGAAALSTVSCSIFPVR